MDLRRVRRWEWLTGLAGLVLLVSLFLPWYGLEFHDVGGLSFSTSETANAWESFAVVDVVMAIAALGAIALPIVTSMQRTAAVPQATTALLMPFAIAAAIVALVRLLNVPDETSVYANLPLENARVPIGAAIDVTREVGAWLGALAAVAVFFLDARSMGDPRTPHAMRSRLDVVTI